MIDRIPAEKDWDQYKSEDLKDDIDVMEFEHSKKRFLGKSNDEILSWFEDGGSIGTGEDIENMTRVPFRYYIFGYQKYILSEVPLKIEDSDAASCYLNLFLTVLQKNPEYLRPIMQELYPSIEYVAENQMKFDATIDIYGDFKEKLEKIRQLCEEMNFHI